LNGLAARLTGQSPTLKLGVEIASSPVRAALGPAPRNDSERLPQPGPLASHCVAVELGLAAGFASGVNGAAWQAALLGTS